MNKKKYSEIHLFVVVVLFLWKNTTRNASSAEQKIFYWKATHKYNTIARNKRTKIKKKSEKNQKREEHKIIEICYALNISCFCFCSLRFCFVWFRPQLPQMNAWFTLRFQLPPFGLSIWSLRWDFKLQAFTDRPLRRTEIFTLSTHYTSIETALCLKQDY